MPDARTSTNPYTGGNWRARYGYAIALMVLALSLLLVLVAWQKLRQRELRVAEEQFRTSSGQVASLVELRLSSLEVTLRGGASLFTTLGEPTAEQWRGYVQALQLDAKLPQLVGLGYAAYVPGDDLVRVQERWRDLGHGRLDIRPRGRRDTYGPILFLEPETAANRAVIGYDMYSEPIRHAAMRAAMETGASRLSARITLAQDAPRNVPGLLLYTPVYGPSAPPADADAVARRARMRGWVYAPLRVSELLSGATDLTPSVAGMRVVDVTADAPTVLYADRTVDGEHTFTLSIDKTFHGRTWRIDLFSGPVATAAPQLAAVDRLMVAGVCGALLLFALAWLLASTEARAQQLAGRMTDSYRRSEQRFRNAMQYSGIGKALLDTGGAIVEVNPAFGRIVGRSADQLVGLRFDSLLEDVGPSPWQSAQPQGLDEAEGVVRLTRRLRDSRGLVRYVHLTYAPVPNEPGTDVVQLVQVEDITQRVEAEEAVQRLNRTLEARVAARTRELSDANRELESFAYSVSHDLRAPLRGIEGFSRLLIERHAGALDETGRDYLGRVRKATGRMGELIDALLKLSRIGRMEMRNEDVDLSALAEEVAASLADAEPGRAVEFTIEPGLACVGNRMLLHTLLENLLGNAWKFTAGRDPARIAFVRERDAEGIDWFVVRDNGAGFEAGFVDKLFRPFQRLHSQDEFPGHGIGLASVKRIVERHGGRIAATGAAGDGASFRFTIADPAVERDTPWPR